MSSRLLALACLISMVSAETTPSIEDIIKQIFGQANNTSSVTTVENSVLCQLKNGDTGECVTYYLCDDNNTIITDGTDVIDLRFKATVGSCPSYMDVCCKLPNMRQTDDRITPEVQQRQGCGNWNKNGVGFEIIGDYDGESKFGEFPWMIAVLRMEPLMENNPDGPNILVYVGGGTLIHPSVVMTSAHITTTAAKMKVRAGEWDTQTTKEIYPHQERGVAQVEVHKDFYKKNASFDIALLFLKSPMDLAPNVGVACLPPLREPAVSGTRCFATGWGKDKFGKEGRYQVILKKVELPVVEHRKCQNNLRKTRLSRFYKLHDSFMCAGGEPGKDACKGDAGSPLVCPIEGEPDRLMQRGIVTWGIGCGQINVPGVYMDVGKLRDWIDDKVIGHGYDPIVYTYPGGVQ